MSRFEDDRCAFGVAVFVDVIQIPKSQKFGNRGI